MDEIQSKAKQTKNQAKHNKGGIKPLIVWNKRLYYRSVKFTCISKQILVVCRYLWTNFSKGNSDVSVNSRLKKIHTFESNFQNFM